MAFLIGDFKFAPIWSVTHRLRLKLNFLPEVGFNRTVRIHQDVIHGGNPVLIRHYGRGASRRINIGTRC